MVAPTEKPFRVFFSWQSDLPGEVNTRLIRSVLDMVASELNSDHELNLHVTRDEATRDLPGSPNIADAIFNKIRQAEVFVCDLSKVAEFINEAGETRKYCNPNVAIELGYAIRVLGWDRIVLVFNSGYGKVPDDLPFDARGHLTLAYSCKGEFDEKGKMLASCKAQMSNAKGHLKTGLAEALKRIVVNNPKCPEESEKPTPEQEKRIKDVATLTKFFHWINLDAMDRFLHYLGHNGWLTNEGYFLCERLGWLLESTKFHLHDQQLLHKLMAFMSAWEKCFIHLGEHMDQHRNGQVFFFNVKDGDGGKYVREQNQRAKFNGEQAKPLKAAFSSFLDYVRENYMEIEPETCGQEALAEYKEEEVQLKNMIKLQEEYEAALSKHAQQP